MRIIDTHQHLIYPEKYRYSWTDGIPQLKGKAFRWDDYLAAGAGTGIERSIFMVTAPDDPHWRDEAEFARGLDVAGAIVGCRPERADFEAQLERLQHPRVVGLRRILHVMPDELSQSEQFVAGIRLLEKYRLTFDLCFLARQLPLAVALAQQCPGVQFILDHCGVPDIAADALDPWRDHIRQLAKLPHVACKISGVLAYCKPDRATAAAVRPYVEHCLEQFGWDRVVWGSDWPVCLMTSTLKEWVDIALELTTHATPTDREKLFSRNATRIYRLR
jgi:predicted TIM-barrel fold metal-dependent hydrolase